MVGYPSVFAHGMLTMGKTGRLLTDVFGPESVARFGGRFTSQVFPGDSLTGTMVIDAIEVGVVEVSVTTTNQDGATVLQATGAARIDR